jgi:hypothetical protein
MLSIHTNRAIRKNTVSYGGLPTKKRKVNMGHTLRSRIPEQFFMDTSTYPQIRSVGNLLDQLKQLPRELPVKSGMADWAQAVVYNINTDAFLTLEEPT